MRKTNLFFLLLMSFATVFGQDRSELPVFKHPKSLLVEFLSKEMSEIKGNDSLCLSSISFVKFSIDTEGKVCDVTFNRDSPAALNERFLKLVSSTNGFWTPANDQGKPIKSKPFVLPVIYTFIGGCPDQRQDLETPLHAMLQFGNDESYTQLDCILLTPIYYAIHRRRPLK